MTDILTRLRAEWAPSIPRELLAGAVATCALIPEVIAFSVVAGVDPSVGLFASFVIGIVIAFAGARPAMVSAAAGSVALVAAPLVQSHGLEYLFAAGLLAGAVQVLFGLMRLGVLVRFVSSSVRTGFVNALAILIFSAQLPHLRGAIACLSEEERAEMDGQDIPSFAQVWALGFMFAVENWPEDWELPRDKEVAGWLDDSLDCIVALTEDDTGKPEVSMYSEDGEPSTSNARVEAFGAAIWAVYDLRQLWKSLGPRIESVRKAPEPGRNDPCNCGSGKKYKKCCGA